MTPDEVALVLSKAALVDNRTIGEEEVMAWHEIVGRLDFNDALAAVGRHYGETRDRLMPADLIRHARIVRDERARVEQRSAPRALPGRYESDPERDQRNKENLARIRRDIIGPLTARMRVPDPGQWIPTPGAPKGAWWEDENKREEHANQLLEAMGRLHPKEEER